MKFNTTVTNGILFCLYLSRAGRARTIDAASTLGISNQYLSQIALKLKRANLVLSVRGPNGGYELISNTTVLQVINALSDRQPVNPGLSTEIRAFNALMVEAGNQFKQVFNKKFNEINQNLVNLEVSQLEAASISV